MLFKVFCNKYKEEKNTRKRKYMRMHASSFLMVIAK